MYQPDKMGKLKIFFLCVLVTCICSSNQIKTAIVHEIRGKVIGVKDGDTIEILYAGSPLTIRLAYIDCPEIRKSQPFGKAAKQFTADHCFGQTVTVFNEKKFDRYRRLIGIVINEKGENVNKALVAAGFAWHFKKYSQDVSYNELELIARKNKMGLWADRNPTPPWNWRKTLIHR